MVQFFVHPDLHSFPTRRSSDLNSECTTVRPPLSLPSRVHADQALHALVDRDQGAQEADKHLRSEEHTSELQSQSNLVCRLLLEKKNETAASERSSRSALSHVPL